MEIKTLQAWWTTVDDNWPQILAIFDRFLPAFHDNRDIDGSILKETLLNRIIRFKEERDIRLHMYVQAAWREAPDSPSLSRIKGWHILCDLLAFTF